MKKRYENPICDLFFMEDELLNVNSRFGTGNNNNEDFNPGGLDGTVENGPGGGGSEVNPDDLGAKGTNPIFDF